jgi:hypothetical protein
MLTQQVQDWLEVWGDRFNAPSTENVWELKNWAEQKLRGQRDPLLRMVLEDFQDKLSGTLAH